jgi:uncharacterized protein (TIGR02145 family)
MKYSTRLFFVVLFSGFLLVLEGQEVIKDYDGNGYKTIKVGSRVWMAENLRVTHYRNGDSIPDVKKAEHWDLLTEGAYCDLCNDLNNTKAFGRIYNWYSAADVRNVCPTGWHVPSESEWAALVSFLAGENEDGAASVKIPGKIHPGFIKLNEGLFNVLPEGFRGYEGEFTGLGYGGGGWWSATRVSAETAFYFGVNYNTAGSQHMERLKSFGYNIRCIKD